MADKNPRWKQRFDSNRQARRWNLTSLALTIPLLLVAYFYYGGQALRTAAIAALAAFLAEVVAGKLILRRRTWDDWNAVVVGLWIALMLPAHAAVYAAVGAVFAIVVVKTPFGGTLHTPFSPAAAGFAFITVCFPGAVFHYLPSEFIPPVQGRSLGALLNLGHNAINIQNINGILLGQTVGPMGTGVIVLIAFLLLAMLCLKSRRGYAFTSLGFLLMAAFLAFLFPRIDDTMTFALRLSSIGMELFSGSLLFAAVFLLPEPSTMPGRWYTRMFVGAVAGAFAILLRHLPGGFEDSVVFAILLANATLPLLYRLQSEVNQQREFRQLHTKDEGVSSDG